MTKTHITLILCILTLACSPGGQSENSTRTTKLLVEYARKFQIEENQLIVTEPWPGAVAPIKYPLNEAPKRVVVTSTTHLPYLEMLDVDHTLVGFPNTGYISSAKIRKRVGKGEITDLGPDGNINMELLLSLQPDVVFAFDMGNESSSLDKISESGIPVIYNADYLETSALGRAEWIKFFGAFYEKEAEADSIFNEITTTYDSLKSLASTVEKRPGILSGVLYGDAWFLPGGQNWAAEFYRDAGGKYLWEDDSASGWLEISFESVFDKARSADYWIGISTFNTLNELAGQDERYTDFQAFKNRQVYNYNKRISPSGGYDFFESGYARPDLVLADLISILHPQLLPGYETYYFQKVP